jgi:DNA-binding NtrC family response regulator
LGGHRFIEHGESGHQQARSKYDSMTDPKTENAIRHLREKQALAALVGEAPVFLDAIGELPAIASVDGTVLIEGETGTGKELVARAIHYLSPRASFPFVPVNCGALPDTLLEDDLFGHERGAFTDAQARRPGLVAQAEKGTLFLDEVDALRPRAQVALLRLLQDKTFRALGSSRERRVEVRFVAATNTPLNRLVEAGTFRSDLYYRLCVFSISLPPLCDRGEDVLSLAYHFIRKHTSDDKGSPQLSVAACATLVAYKWPGNVRELENAVIRGVHRCQAGTIEVADLGLPFSVSLVTCSCPTTSSLKALKKQVVEDFERRYLTQLLAEHHGNVSRAAEAAGKERRAFGKLLKRYHIKAKLFACSSPSSPEKNYFG